MNRRQSEIMPFGDQCPLVLEDNHCLDSIKTARYHRAKTGRKTLGNKAFLPVFLFLLKHFVLPFCNQIKRYGSLGLNRIMKRNDPLVSPPRIACYCIQWSIIAWSKPAIHDFYIPSFKITNKVFTGIYYLLASPCVRIKTVSEILRGRWRNKAINIQCDFSSSLSF